MISAIEAYQKTKLVLELEKTKYQEKAKILLEEIEKLINLSINEGKSFTSYTWPNENISTPIQTVCIDVLRKEGYKISGGCSTKVLGIEWNIQLPPEPPCTPHK